MYFLLGLGLICTIWAVRATEFDEEIYVLHNKDKSVQANEPHILQNKNKLQNNHDSLELSFPLFPEWDESPPYGLDGKLKDPSKNFQDDKDPFTDIMDTQLGKIFKPKKKPKDKFIMTFTEFFIPIMNHKNLDFPNMPRKLDFLEDFFKDFPLKDIEEQPIMKHKRQKKFLDFNPFFSFVRNTSSKLSDLFNNNITLNNATKKFETRRLGSLFLKPNDELLLQRNKVNETETIPKCCAGHTDCQMNAHCKRGMCTDQPEEENVYITKLKQMANINKLSRIMLFYTVPILLGVGGIVIATEIIRKHNTVKHVQFLKEYDPIQNC